MDDKPSFRPFLVSTIVLVVVGWGGLFALLNFTLPTLWARWGFFVLAVSAATGTAIPLIFLLHALIPSKPPAEPKVIVREAIWVGIYFAILAWLSIGRILNFSIGLWLALGLAAIEYLFRVRETTAKRTNDVSSQPPLG